MAELTAEDLEQLLEGDMNSKQKGKRGELEFARLCRDNGYEARRSQQFKGSADSADVEGLPHIHVEVKRVERLNIEDAMSQSRRDSGAEEIPIVAHRKNNCPWLITLSADDFFKLYREWEASRETS